MAIRSTVHRPLLKTDFGKGLFKAKTAGEGFESFGSGISV